MAEKLTFHCALRTTNEHLAEIKYFLTSFQNFIVRIASPLWDYSSSNTLTSWTDIPFENIDKEYGSYKSR